MCSDQKKRASVACRTWRAPKKASQQASKMRTDTISTTLTKDWAGPRTTLAFTGHVRSEGKYEAGTHLRCVCLNTIPCTAEGAAAAPKTRYSVTVIEIPKGGTSYAPYKKSKDGKAVREKTAQPLAEVAPAGTSVKLYSFAKTKNNMEKGPRDENLTFTIRCGQTLTFYLNDWMFGADRNVFQEGVDSIPAYSMVDFIISSTNNEDPKGYGFKINRIVPHASTLYSYMTPSALMALPSNKDTARAQYDAHALVSYWPHLLSW